MLGDQDKVCVPPYKVSKLCWLFTLVDTGLAFGIPMIWWEKEKTHNWVLPLKRFLVIIRKLGRNSVTEIWIRQFTQCSIQTKYLYQFLHSCLPKKMKVIPMKQWLPHNIADVALIFVWITIWKINPKVHIVP